MNSGGSSRRFRRENGEKIEEKFKLIWSESNNEMNVWRKVIEITVELRSYHVD